MRISSRGRCAALTVLVLAIAAVGCAPEPLGGVAAVGKGNSDGAKADPIDVDIDLVPLAERPGHCFEIDGLDERALDRFSQLDPVARSLVLSVQVVGELDNPPPLLGVAARSGDHLTFTPRFPLEPGVRYRVSLDPTLLLGAVVAPSQAEFSLKEEPPKPSTVVAEIYPTADVLPENQLKFYLHFSAPMSRGEAYRHVHLIDADTGDEVEAAFLELGEELWDGDFRRFTLLCDPGRVKRGLKPREELGPVLREGHNYTLAVDKDWRDATRTPLAAGAQKKFSVGPPDEEPIDPASWKLEPPAAGDVEPLVVHFGEPLDRALLERVVWVADESGEKVSGSIRTSDHEATWQFTPEHPWRAGSYQLVAETTLEDLAGNSIGRPFEVDEVKPFEKRIESETVSIPFTVSP